MIADQDMAIWFVMNWKGMFPTSAAERALRFPSGVRCPIGRLCGHHRGLNVAPNFAGNHERNALTRQKEEFTESHCSTVGLLILETYGDEADILQMESKLRQLKGMTVKKMVFQL
jgi:hypothetical protein